MHRTKRTIVLVGLLSLAAIQSVDGADGKPLRFRGAKLQDKKSGLLVMPMKPMQSVVLSSTQHHYWLVLPYSETWTFTSTDRLPLEGIDDRYIVTLTNVEGGVNDLRAYLDEILTKLQAEPLLEIRDPSVFEEKGRPVLRYQAHVTDAKGIVGVWQWNYWTVATHAQAGMVLHLSSADPTFAPEKHEQHVRICVGSLRADFKVTP